MVGKARVSAALLVALLLVAVPTAVADEPPCKDFNELYEDDVCIYVNPHIAAEQENGSQLYPYNNEREGWAYARSISPDGGVVIVLDEEGQVEEWELVPYARSIAWGVPVPRLVLYGVLGATALVLIVLAWQFNRRARQPGG